MSWIDQKDSFDTSGGILRRNTREDSSNKKKIEKMYSISEVAKLLSVSRPTIFKWLSLDEPETAIIPPKAWVRLPNGYIRIREWIVIKLQDGNI